MGELCNMHHCLMGMDASAIGGKLLSVDSFTCFLPCESVSLYNCYHLSKEVWGKVNTLAAVSRTDRIDRLLNGFVISLKSTACDPVYSCAFYKEVGPVTRNSTII